MQWKEMLRDEREEGRIEGLIQGRIDSLMDMMQDFEEDIPAHIVQKVQTTTDENTLILYSRYARRAKSLKEFEELINQ